MCDTMTLAELRGRGVRFRADEAVAIAQQLMCGSAESCDAHPPYGLLSEQTVAVGPDGRVYCCASATTPSVAEIGILLQDMLEEPGSSVPGGLRYAIGRALLEVEAPPFDSLDEFAAALRRFEKESAPAVITGLYSRAVLSTATKPDDLRGAYRGAERRLHMPSSTELRRQLRDTDRRLFEASRPVVSARAGGRSQRHGRAPFTAGIVACSALIAASGLAYTGGLAYTRLTGGGANGHRLTAAPQRSSATATEPITATPIESSAMALPSVHALDASWHTSSSPAGASRQARFRSAAGMSHNSLRARPSPPERLEPERQRARSAQARSDDRRVLARLRFEWDNPFKRSH